MQQIQPAVLDPICLGKNPLFIVAPHRNDGAQIAALLSNHYRIKDMLEFANSVAGYEQLAHDLQPIVSAYIDQSTANATPHKPAPPVRQENPDEAQLDSEDLATWEEVLRSVDDIYKTPPQQPRPEAIGKTQPTNPKAKPAPSQHLNRAARRALARKAA